MLEKIGLHVLHLLEPERAHNLSLCALKLGLVSPQKQQDYPRLHTSVGGINVPNPIGLAAGYDKNAVALHPLARLGFGFLEVGAATPRPQSGNPRPRLFRLSLDQAVINRFGFNNDGIETIAMRLAATPTPIPRGLNLGANKNSENRAKDYGIVLKKAAPFVDFVTVNVSSPNTQNLRNLQHGAALHDLLNLINEANATLPTPKPIFLKIAPDLQTDEIHQIAQIAIKAQLSAIIATNTTVARDGLQDPNATQAGGLSGRPLFERSTRVLAQLSKATEGKIDLIGVGGVSSAQDAFAKIEAGACAVQLYSAMVYHGTRLIGKITQDLDAILAKRGFETLHDAVGSAREKWL